MQRGKEPVLFATPGKDKKTLKQFAQFLRTHKGSPEEILGVVVCDMSPAFLSGIDEAPPNAEVTVDWLHIVQTLTRAGRWIRCDAPKGRSSRYRDTGTGRFSNKVTSTT